MLSWLQRPLFMPAKHVERVTAAIIVFFLFNTPLLAQTKNLDYYINSGIANSPLLKDYQNQVSSNYIDSQRLRATYRPQVNGMANNSIAR